MSGGVIVNRWTKYGHDRLYVSVGEAKLGYWDAKTRTLHPATPDVTRELQSALDTHWSATGEVAGGQLADPVFVPEQVTPPDRRQVEAAPAAERPWTDLALSRPGGAVREQALAARDAAPVRARLARVLGVHTDERAWRIGADGEEAVAARLGRLPEPWRVLHAVPVGSRGSDIDHVVVGPGGVYTVNAKHHPGASVWVGGNTFMVNGRKQPYIRNSRFEAARASKMLTALAGFPVFVTGVIAVVGADEGFTIKSQPPNGEVVIVARKQIANWLLQRGVVMSAEQVDRLFQIARRSTTWTD